MDPLTIATLISTAIGLAEQLWRLEQGIPKDAPLTPEQRAAFVARLLKNNEALAADYEQGVVEREPAPLAPKPTAPSGLPPVPGTAGSPT